MSIATDTPSSDSGKAVTWGMTRRHYVLFVLCLLMIFAYIDRQIMAILLQPIKEEFQASDTVMGLLTGLVFAGFYVLASIPLARLADRYTRKGVLTASLAFWSVMTTFGGFVTNAWQLAFTRIGVAAAEGGAMPSSHSIISDLYPLRFRGTAIGILASCQSIGIGLAVFLGGIITAAFGWRSAFIMVGLPGLLLATLMYLTVPEPPRGLSDAKRDTSPAPPLGQTLRQLWGIRTYRCLILIVAFTGCTGYGFLNWGPTFLIRIHKMSPGDVGALFGFASAVSLIVGNFMGGLIADWLGRRDVRAYLWIAGAGPVLSVPGFLLFVTAQDSSMAAIGLFLGLMFVTTHIPTAYSMAQTLVPLRMRATASVFMTVASTLTGTGLTPVFIGAVNDALDPTYGVEAVRYSLAIVILTALGGAAMAFLGLIWLKRDYAASQAEAARV